MEVSRATHLKLAFAIWGLVGAVLLTVGVYFIFRDRSLSELEQGRSGPGMMEGIGLIVALAIGFIKGNFVITKVARRNIARIEALPAQSPIYATFSLKSWMLVLGMMLIGTVIRLLGASYFIRGLIYVAVGFALALGSRAYLKGSSQAPIARRVSS